MSHDVVNIEGVKQEPALLQKHAKFFVRFLNLLPARLASHDSTRGTIAFFAVCGLDVLNSLPLLTKEMQKDVIEWIYGGLVTSNPEKQPSCSGFQVNTHIVYYCAQSLIKSEWQVSVFAYVHKYVCIYFLAACYLQVRVVQCLFCANSAVLCLHSIFPTTTIASNLFNFYF